MQVKVFVESSTAITFIWRMYTGFVMFVALTVKWALSRVYGKSLSSVILILVFSVGLADGGMSARPDFVVGMVADESELVTVWLFILIYIPYDWPADASTSNSLVRHTREVELDTYGTHVVSRPSVNLISTVLVSICHGNCVPEMVKLSPPSKLSWVFGVIDDTVQKMVVVVRLTLLFTKP